MNDSLSQSTTVEMMTIAASRLLRDGQVCVLWASAFPRRLQILHG